MINPSFHLFQLQKIDLKMDSLNKRLAEIDRIRHDNTARKSIEQSLSDISQSYLTQKSIYTAVEEKVRTKKIKIEQSEGSLYSGTIKNPKELQDLQAEVRSLKLSLTTLEDDQLQQLIQLETAEQELSAAEKSLAEFDAKLELQYATLFSEESDRKIELDRLIQERKVVLEQISSDQLALYQSLRKTKNGIALSSIEDGCCTVCGSMLTPADCQTAKSPIKMATCSSCGRILYAG